MGEGLGVPDKEMSRGGWFRSCKPIRVTKGQQPVKMEVKSRAQNDKTRALCALKHVVILCSNTSILTGC